VRVGEDTVHTMKIPGAVVTEWRPGGKYGYIDKTGRMVIAPQFAKAEQFYGGLAFVCFDSTVPVDPAELHQPCGYIDHSGKFIWQPTQ